MTKNTKLLMGIIAGLLILASVAGGLYWGASVDSIFGEKEANLADIEWYDENATEFTITSAQELYDLATLSQYYTFEEQTVKLGSDIVINEGNAADWKTKAPQKKWFPIVNFAGNFDGQGHTISGLYGKGADTNMGLFSNTKPKAVIQDFKLINSYFVVSGANVGAISANGSGTYKNIYTDAILSNDSKDGTGGFIGKVDSAGASAVVGFFTTFENCWFDGEIQMTKRDGVTAGGFVGLFTSGTLEIKNSKSSGVIDVPSKGRSPQTGGFVGDTKVEIGNILMNFDGLVCDTKITTNGANYVASYIGHVRAKCKVDIKNCYVTYEAFEGNAIGTDNNDHTGEVIQLSEAALKGYGGYSWTNLDFDKYWSVVKDDIPTLKCFTNEHPSLEGVKKAYSVDWYNQYDKELVLNTKEDFMGFCLLPYMDAVTYKGQVVKLGCDVVINEGKAKEWGEQAPSFRFRPVGIYKIPFQGTFDGQGHTISGVYAKGQNYVGLFGYAETDSVIKNLKITNSYFEGHTSVGSLVGRTKGNVDTIYSDATVVSVGSCVGGIVGQTLEQTKPPLKQTINNCWFDGRLEARSDAFSFAGGILGDNRNNEVTISHCLFTGTLVSQSDRYNVFLGGICGVAKNAEAVTIIDNCLSTGKLEAPVSEQKSGVASLLGYAYNKNSKIIDSYATTECWKTATSYLGNAASTSGQWDKARLIGIGGYQWTTLDFVKYWTTVSNGTPILKSFATKTQSVAGVERYLDNSWYDKNKKEYVLDSRGDLLYFNILAGSETFEGKTVKLGANITLNSGDAGKWNEEVPEFVWTPIGTGSYPFAGTFDGQGHAISGVYIKKDTSYAGLFAVTGEKSMVKNLKLLNSYIEGTELVGSIVGRLRGNLDTIYSNAYVVANGGCNGGIAGQTLTTGDKQLKITINNCWYDGTMTLTHTKWLYSGGILGDNRNNDVTITNCLYTGLIQTESAMYNLFIGGINGTTGVIGSSTFENAKTTVDGCLSTGRFKTKSTNNGFVASIIGNAVNNKTTLKNCYGTNEGWKYAMAYIGGKVSHEMRFPKATISGNGGYQWTTLDFDKYWAIVEDGTPVLKSFATKVVEAKGDRLVDFSWYNADATTYTLNSTADLLAFDLLAQLYTFEGKTVKLGADITINTGDYTDWENTAPDIQWKPIPKFAGTFNGQGHKISGMYIKEDIGMVGMFAKTLEGAALRNFSLVDSYVEGTEVVGAVVGRTVCDLDTIYSNATVVATKGGSNGGIVGQSLTTGKTPIAFTINNCWYAGELKLKHDAWAYSGGILGDNRNNEATITNCLYTGKISSENDKYNVYLGGINGSTGIYNSVRYQNAKTTIEGCLSTGKFTTKSASNTSVGAILGNSVNDKTTIKNCYGVTEGWKHALAFAADGTKGIQTNIWSSAQLTGFGGYEWTNLDFKNHWTVVEGGVPTLQSFTKTVVEVGTRSRYATWYNGWDTTYKLDTIEDFIGFSKIAQIDDFKGKIVNLAADVKLNNSDAKNWKTEPPQTKWTKIGTPDKPFAGTFDGQMHTISGLYLKDAEYVGMFGVTAEGSVVKNFKLINSYFEAKTLAGSVAGSISGKVNTVYSEAIVVSSEDFRIGGITGQIIHGSVEIENCWFDGEISINKAAGDLRVGGIAGENKYNTTAAIKGCLFSGKISAMNVPESAIDLRIGGIIGFDNATTTSPCTTVIDNCLSVGEIKTTATASPSYVGSIAGRASDKTFPKPTNTYGSTECWSEGTAWWGYNNKITDGQMNLANMLGANGYVYGTMNLSSDYWVYVKDGAPELKSFVKSEVLKLSDANKPDTSWYTSTASGKTYNLTTVGQFLGFGQLSQNHTFAGQTIQLSNELAEGLDLMNIVITPIGTSSYPFTGTFNGNGKTIRNLQIIVNEAGVGLFRYTGVNSVVRNFRLLDSYIEGTEIVGSIVGRSKGNVDTIYSNATVVATTGQCNGGIIGQAWMTAFTMDNCWYAGTLNVNGTGICYSGGILGENRAAEVQITNCLYSGNIITESTAYNPYLGGINGSTGIVGSNAAAKTTIQNCISTGTFKTKSSNNGYVSSILGNALNTNTTVSNSYGLQDSWKWAFAYIAGTDDQNVKNNHLLPRVAMINHQLKDKINASKWAFIKDGTPELKSFIKGEELP